MAPFNLPFLKPRKGPADPELAPHSEGDAPLSAGDEKAVSSLLQDFSIEVMPRTAAKIENFRDHLPQGTRVYIAHIPGTPLDDMVETTRRLVDEGFEAMPHITARVLPDQETFETALKRYRDEAGVKQALVLAGGESEPAKGPYDSSRALFETGLFDKHGYKRLHVAGHPEGNKDIAPDGVTEILDDALVWKQDFAERTDAEMAIVTQFAFDAAPVLDWIDRLRTVGITMPVHVGIAGPAKLQTLIKYAAACGVGPSLNVLKKRAQDVSKLLLPYTPDAVLADFARAQTEPGKPIAKIHVFPLGGIKTATEYARDKNAT